MRKKKESSDRIGRLFLGLSLVLFIFSFIRGRVGVMFLVMTFVFFFVAILIQKSLWSSWGKAVRWFIDFFKDVSWYYFVLLGITLLVSMLLSFFTPKISNLDRAIELAPAEWMIITGIAAGPLEELLFRAGILNLARKTIFRLSRYKDWYAILLSSAVFALVHVIGDNAALYLPVYIIPTFIIGAVLGTIYLKKGLAEVMWIHSIFNLVSFSIGYLSLGGSS